MTPEDFRRKANMWLTGTVDAPQFTQNMIAIDLRTARDAAGLTQAQLAAKLGKSEADVARAEAGDTRVGEKYLRAVLAACGLPKDWKLERGSR
jgi:transcriptional regulator with XRE-family HTH domain